MRSSVSDSAWVHIQKLYLSQTTEIHEPWNTKLTKFSQHKVLPHFWPFSHWVRHEAGLSSEQNQTLLALKEVAKSIFPMKRLRLPEDLHILKPHIIFLHFPTWKMIADTNIPGSSTAWEFGSLRKLMGLPKWWGTYPREKRFRRGTPSLSNDFLHVGNNSVCITPQLLYAIRLKLGYSQRKGLPKMAVVFTLVMYHSASLEH